MEFLILLCSKLFNLLSFPIARFWECYDKYKAEKKLWKIILLFVVSLLGLALICGAFVALIYYIFTYHFEWVVIVGLILWLYGYVKSKMDKNAMYNNAVVNNVQEAPAVDPVLENFKAQAEKGYPIMRNIMFQTSKEVASSIGAKSPRLLQEIEIPGEHYSLTNDICFYQFKLKKADPLMQYNLDDLALFREQYQDVCSQMIASGNFPTLQMQNFMDAYGNWYDAVNIDVIEDVGNTFIIQSVFVTPAYTEYKHQLQLNQQDMSANMSVPDATWKS